MVENEAHILFADRDLEWSRPTRERLRSQGFRVSAVTAARDLLELAARRPPDVVLLDEALDRIGAEVLVGLLRDKAPAAGIVLLLEEGRAEGEESRRHLNPDRCLARPVEEAALTEAVMTVLLTARVPRARRKAPVIMCVDDDPFYLESLARLLRRHGYGVATYDNPEDALAAFPLVKPDMVFLDVLMPGMNGLDFVQEVRVEHGTAVPIVLLSGLTSDKEISEGYRSGALYYLTKPCEPQRLINLVKYFGENLDARERALLEREL